ncbi:MAG: serine hydrolase domain-containing protein [Candidatus Nanopelagicales bacterium]
MPSTSDLAEAVDRPFDQLFATGTVPGLVYGLISGGELVHTRGLGLGDRGDPTSLPTAETVFRIASMTKSFTAATVLSLRDGGLLGLDDRVTDYIPELRAGGAFTKVLTVRHLLTMSGGFPTDDPWGDRQQDLPPGELGKLLATGFGPLWRPGDRFEYSNLGYALIGRVIEAVTNQQYRDIVQERVLGPLGLVNTRFDVADVASDKVAVGYVLRDEDWAVEPISGYGAFAPMGGLLSTVSDLARWVAEFQRSLVDQGDVEPDLATVSLSSLREMQTGQRWVEALVEPSVSKPLSAPSVWHYGYGLFEEVSASGRTIGHSGGYPGFGSHMRWDSEHGLGVVALGNRTYVPVARAAAAALESAVKAVKAVAPSRRRSPVAATSRVAEAQQVAQHLADAWDEDLARAWFADNVEQDQPLALRRKQLDQLRERHGHLVNDNAGAAPEIGPASATWWLRGELGGRVKVHLLMSPHPVALIQALTWTSVPEPSGELKALAQQVLAAVDHQATLGEPIAGDGERLATFAAKTTIQWIGSESAPAVGELDYEVDAKTEGESAVRRVTLRTEMHPEMSG